MLAVYVGTRFIHYQNLYKSKIWSSFQIIQKSKHKCRKA